MREVNMESLAISPPEESKQFLDGMSLFPTLLFFFIFIRVLQKILGLIELFFQYSRVRFLISEARRKAWEAKLIYKFWYFFQTSDMRVVKSKNHV